MDWILILLPHRETFVIVKKLSYWIFAIEIHYF